MTAARVRNRPAARTPRVASDKQLDFIVDLLNSRQAPDAYREGMTILISATRRAHQGHVRDDDPRPMDSTYASTVITYLREDCKPKATEDAVTTEGVFEHDGSVYLVTLSRADRLYARVYTDPNGETKVANWHEPQSVTLTYAPGMVRKLRESDRCSDARQRELGTLTARCIDCNAQLTNSASIARGKGPICASK